VPGPTPHYPPEFKREAVQLYRSSEKSIPKVSQELSIRLPARGRPSSFCDRFGEGQRHWPQRLDALARCVGLRGGDADEAHGAVTMYFGRDGERVAADGLGGGNDGGVGT
jgi:hypothetical protein